MPLGLNNLMGEDETVLLELNIISEDPSGVRDSKSQSLPNPCIGMNRYVTQRAVLQTWSGSLKYCLMMTGKG
jgi:hypothetical protein